MMIKHSHALPHCFRQSRGGKLRHGETAGKRPFVGKEIADRARGIVL
jgi:hypothetical protein